MGTISRIVAILIILVVWTTSCRVDEQKTKPSEIEAGMWKVQVVHRAGEAPSDQAFLNLPFNIAQRDSLKYIVLGKPLISTDSIGVAIVGGLQQQKSRDRFLLCIPVDTRKQTIKVEDLIDLSTTHAASMWLIEYYVSHAFGDAKGYTWFDKATAEKIIKESTKQSPF